MARPTLRRAWDATRWRAEESFDCRPRRAVGQRPTPRRPAIAQLLTHRSPPNVMNPQSSRSRVGAARLQGRQPFEVARDGRWRASPAPTSVDGEGTHGPYLG